MYRRGNDDRDYHRRSSTRNDDSQRINRDSERRRDRSPKSHRGGSQRSNTGSNLASGGMTPLFFKGSGDSVMIKPFVPSVNRPSQRSSDQLSSALTKPNTDISTKRNKEEISHESMMQTHEMPEKGQNSDFAFMHVKDEFNAFEWEQKEKEMDRAWYDAEEDGNIRYGGGGEDPFEEFLSGPSEEEKSR